MPRLADDLRYGLRLLARAPAFAALAILTLALGVGANTAIFSVVDSLLIRPLPYPDPDRLVLVWEDASKIGFPHNTPAPANWVDWRKRNTVFEDIAATRGEASVITGDGPPEQLGSRRVTSSFWQVMGVQPVVGRVFTSEEEKADSSVAVISNGLWQRKFGGDPNVLGRKLIVDGRSFSVIGVMPRAFAIPSRMVEFWMPSGFTAEDLARRSSHYLVCFARLKAGVGIHEAQAEMSAIAAQLTAEFPADNYGLGAVVTPLRDEVLGERRTALIALLCAAGCVLLIACANIANLLLVRGLERQREFALRTALGASRDQLVLQLVSESLLLAGLGAIGGLAFAKMGMKVLESLIPPGLAANPLSIDGRVLGFTVGVAMVTGLLFGVAPALASTWLNVNSVLKQGGRSSAGFRHRSFRDALVVTQVCLAMLLLAGAGLMIRTLYNYQSMDPGFRVDHLLAVETFLPKARYPEHRQRLAFAEGVIEKVRAVPGVTGAGYTSALPLISMGNSSGYLLEGQQEKEVTAQDALFRVVTPDFLRTIGARLREGRFLTAEDRADTLPAVIINETFANRYWPGTSPVGRRLQISEWGPGKPWLTIVGVVREIRERGINIETKPAVYMPLHQAETAWPVPNDLVIRTTADPLSIVPAVRQAVWSVAPDQPLASVRTMEDVAQLETASRRQTMILLGAFAGLSLLLAFIGIYGLLSYSVAQREREIGIRVALGAGRSRVLGMIAGKGMALALTGVALGWGAAAIASRSLQSLLFGISANDVTTLATVSALLMLVALTACLIPARRAVLLDPASSLRQE
jgi:predicted permease